ncbi:hypothetical protein N7478_012596 [Penicillium angulare]|uniref:uncharacterized protein n=1 Tax=Penicillium angulare TaxID=116970 RepID=UPI0025425EED|nr:uncharacterized protein N7478_012596 [Penicillium angulare]KAJ5259615.1 hypothetical protein N7478_012596 [Penicillium angulare]
MGDSFHFIDGYQPSRESKRLMRRHVMKGKNIGKTIQRGSRSGKQADSVQISYSLTAATRSDRGEPSLDKNPKPWCLRGSAFEHPCLTILFPGMEITPWSVKIIDKFQFYNETFITSSARAFTR